MIKDLIDIQLTLLLILNFELIMEQDEKRKLADELRNAADDVLNLDDMEKVAGGLLDLKCVNNNVALCGCTQTSTEKLQQATKDQG